ncbi:thioredoxin family protein (plasmid) [Bacillus mycoides]|uniref:thioredoxin family protein n=1 Tax=Bacillus mycoides TaxID=1405 RepID=UPI001C02EE73|nr:thioredoxin family protein [Bacillus mycoides]QWH63963.1 thioredoxin family protein [Bacillus mycoides]
MKKIFIFVLFVILIFGAIFLVTNQNKEEVSAKDYYKNAISQKQLQQDILDKKEKFIYYYQTSCPHCAKVSPIVIPMAKKMNIDMQVMNLEEYQQGWEKFKISGTPTIIHFKGGKEANRIEGEQPEENFKSWFEKNK